MPTVISVNKAAAAKGQGRFEKNPFDSYQTTPKFVEAVFDCLDSLVPAIMPPRNILDPGAGLGVWGRYAKQRWKSADLHGVELDSTYKKPDEYDCWWNGDFLTLPLSGGRFDLVIGNPPYGSKQNPDLGEYFVRKSLDLLTPKGVLIFLMKDGFSSTVGRKQGLFREHRLWAKVDCGRIPFNRHTGSNTYDYGLYIWRRDVSANYTVFKLFDWRRRFLL